MYNSYHVKIRLITDCLGSTPKSPNIFKEFLIDKQNELVEKYSTSLKKSKCIEALNFEGQNKIDAANELEGIFKSIENELGRKLAPSEKETLLGQDSEDFMLELLGEATDTKSTIFLKDSNGLPYLSGHVIKGFLKAATEALCKLKPAKNGVFLGSMAASAKYINTFLVCSDVYFFDEEGKRQDIKRNNGEAEYCSRPLRAKTAKGDRIALASSEVIAENSVGEFVLTLLGGDKSPISLKDLKECFEYGMFQGLGGWRGSGSYGMFELIDIKEIKTANEVNHLDVSKLRTLK